MMWIMLYYSLAVFSPMRTISLINAIDITLKGVHWRLPNISVSKSPGPDGWMARKSPILYLCI